jgi:hypothetical protein
MNGWTPKKGWIRLYFNNLGSEELHPSLFVFSASILVEWMTGNRNESHSHTLIQISASGSRNRSSFPFVVLYVGSLRPSAATDPDPEVARSEASD